MWPTPFKGHLIQEISSEYTDFAITACAAALGAHDRTCILFPFFSLISAALSQWFVESLRIDPHGLLPTTASAHQNRAYRSFRPASRWDFAVGGNGLQSENLFL
jgi:hypothetical protein